MTALCSQGPAPLSGLNEGRAGVWKKQAAWGSGAKSPTEPTREAGVMVRGALDVEDGASEPGRGARGRRRGCCLWSRAAALCAAGPVAVHHTLGSQVWLILIAAWGARGAVVLSGSFSHWSGDVDSCQLRLFLWIPDSCKREMGGRIFTAWRTWP